MLSFRNKLNSRDPEAIRKISASTGFFDATDIEISVNLAHSALDGQRHANDNVEEPSFLLAEDNGKTVGYACFGKIQDCNSAYELHLISTLSSYRGHGIGRKMIARLLETVRELGGKIYGNMLLSVPDEKSAKETVEYLRNVPDVSAEEVDYAG